MVRSHLESEDGKNYSLGECPACLDLPGLDPPFDHLINISKTPPSMARLT